METTGLDTIQLYEPEVVAFSFDAIGWTILTYAIVLAVLVIIALKVKAFYKNKYRRDAAKELDKLNGKDLKAIDLIKHLAVLLKHTAMRSFGREQLASVSGNDWLNFLQGKCKGINTNDLKLIAEASYNETLADSITSNQQKKLIQTVKYWINHHA